MSESPYIIDEPTYRAIREGRCDLSNATPEFIEVARHIGYGAESNAGLLSRAISYILSVIPIEYESDEEFYDDYQEEYSKEPPYDKSAYILSNYNATPGMELLCGDFDGVQTYDAHDGGPLQHWQNGFPMTPEEEFEWMNSTYGGV